MISVKVVLEELVWSFNYKVYSYFDKYDKN